MRPWLLRATVLISWSAGIAQAQQGGQQWPSWLPEQMKDKLNELDTSASNDGLLAAEPCRLRLNLLKSLSTVGNPQAGQIRASVLTELGFCELKGGKFAKAYTRFESCISELNAPNEDVLMQNLQTAPMVLMRQAAKALKDFKVSEAGVALRRTRTIYARNWAQILKQVMKQNKIPEEALPQVMPKLKKEKFAVTILGFMEEVESQLNLLDNHLVKGKLTKDRKSRLDGAAGGSLVYLHGLPMESTAETSRLLWLDPFLEKLGKLTGEVEEAKLTKHVTVLKRTKLGGDCEKLPKLCDALQSEADLSTNGFGESRLLVLKENKRQKLDLCETNGNLAVLLALKGSANLNVGPKSDAKKVVLAQGEAVVFDFCLESTVIATTDNAHVLFLQAWHPEVASVERTTFIREKAVASWNLDEATVKSVTKLVNDGAKKTWEKTIKKWRESSSLISELEETLTKEDQKQRDEKKAKEEKEKKDAEAADQDLEAAKEELERKRQAKEEAEAAKKEEKRKRVEEARKKELEREPWRLDPRVVDAREKLSELQEARRDANLKMEFDESTRLTKEVSKAERKLESVTEKAMKYYNKHGTVKVKKEKESAKDAAGDTGKEDPALKTRLKELEEEKKTAVENEYFKKAAQLKKEIADVKKQMGKSEL